MKVSSFDRIQGVGGEGLGLLYIRKREGRVEDVTFFGDLTVWILYFFFNVVDRIIFWNEFSIRLEDFRSIGSIKEWMSKKPSHLSVKKGGCR